MHLAPERSVPILLRHNNVPGGCRRDVLCTADVTSLLVVVEAAPQSDYLHSCTLPHRL